MEEAAERGIVSSSAGTPRRAETELAASLVDGPPFWQKSGNSRSSFNVHQIRLKRSKYMSLLTINITYAC
jgi:hypothetical protein